MKRKRTHLVLASIGALVDVKGQVLLTQRPKDKSMAGFWEFPGGKVEQGERPEEALVRELQEEIDIEVPVENLEPVSFVSQGLTRSSLVLFLFMTRSWKKHIIPREGQNFMWVESEHLSDYQMPPMNASLVKALCRYLSQS